MDMLLDEDIEMMETDDVSDNVIVLQNKRKLSSNDEIINISDISDESSVNFQLRPLLKARRRLPKCLSVETDKSKHFSVTVDESLKPICVLDTNILLSNLTELKSVILTEEKLRQTTTKSKLKSFVIPWIVLQELDRMKTRKRDKSVVNVIHFINEQINKTNGIIRGEIEFRQKSNSKSNKTIEKVEEEVDDDKIVNSCLQLKTITESNVFLITNDINLCNKALMTHLKAINWNQFYDKYKSSDLYSIESTSEDDIIEPKNKRFAKNPSNDKSVSNLRLSLNEKLLNKIYSQSLGSTSSQSSSQSSHKSTSPLKLLSPILTMKRSLNKFASKRKSSLSSGSPSKIVPQKINSSDSSNAKPTSSECPLTYDEWIRFRDECEQKLLKFIELIYREIWANDWKQMLELDVNNTNLKEMIRVMRKEWNANFSDHFNRDKTIKALVDSLHTSLLKSYSNSQLYYKDLKHFVDLVDQKLSILQLKDLKTRKTI